MTTITLKSYGLLVKHWIVSDGVWVLDRVETHIMANPSPWFSTDVIL